MQEYLQNTEHKYEYIPARLREALSMVTNTLTHTRTHTHKQTQTHNNRRKHWHFFYKFSVLIIFKKVIEMKNGQWPDGIEENCTAC